MTTVVEEQVMEAPQVTQLRLADRCDRCQAQAFVITRHPIDDRSCDLLWCVHHYRQHLEHLKPFVVLDDSGKVNKTAI